MTAFDLDLGAARKRLADLGAQLDALEMAEKRRQKFHVAEDVEARKELDRLSTMLFEARRYAYSIDPYCPVCGARDEHAPECDHCGPGNMDSCGPKCRNHPY